MGNSNSIFTFHNFITKRTMKIRLGGVPEHFNLPIHLAVENGEFKSRNIDLEWTTFDGGTGQMTKALRNNEIDACILLTEGIISDIINGNPSKIISVYVNTPLTWGIHTGAQNNLNNKQDIYRHTYAISRFGSGSHLMPIVDANLNDQTIHNSQFKVIHNLNGALESLSKMETDVFYWEKYTTAPYVNKGLLRRVSEFVTPWPCFVIAATDKIIKKAPNEIIRMLRTIHDSCDKFMIDDTAIEKVHKRYQIKLSDVERWFHSTEWAIHGWVSNKMINSVIYNLNKAGIVDQNEEIPEIIWKRN